jgi:hypothetical protein
VVGEGWRAEFPEGGGAEFPEGGADAPGAAERMPGGGGPGESRRDVAHIASLQCANHKRWTVEVLDATVRAELEAQPKDVQARFLRIVELIETHELERVREP